MDCSWSEIWFEVVVQNQTPPGEVRRRGKSGELDELNALKMFSMLSIVKIVQIQLLNSLKWLNLKDPKYSQKKSDKWHSMIARRIPTKKLTLRLQGKVCKVSKGGDDSVAIISLLCIRATSDPLTLPTPNNPFFIIILNHQQMAICLNICICISNFLQMSFSSEAAQQKKVCTSICGTPAPTSSTSRGRGKR